MFLDVRQNFRFEEILSICPPGAVLSDAWNFYKKQNDLPQWHKTTDENGVSKVLYLSCKEQACTFAPKKFACN